MASVSFSITIMDISDNCVFSAFIPFWEIERAINLAVHKYGVDCYMMVSPLLYHSDSSHIYVDKISFHG